MANGGFYGQVLLANNDWDTPGLFGQVLLSNNDWDSPGLFGQVLLALPPRHLPGTVLATLADLGKRSLPGTVVAMVAPLPPPVVEVTPEASEDAITNGAVAQGGLDLRMVLADQQSDLRRSGTSLAIDNGLETAVLISLFSDRLAEADDGVTDRRGWWGDLLAEIPGDRIGSRLWLLAREKQLTSVLNRAADYGREALQWLVDDGVARSVEVTAEKAGEGILGLDVVIVRPDSSNVRYRFEAFWKGN